MGRVSDRKATVAHESAATLHRLRQACKDVKDSAVNKHYYATEIGEQIVLMVAGT